MLRHRPGAVPVEALNPISMENPMSDDVVDRERRRFLTIATAGVGTVGAVFAAYPFVASMKPSVKAQALGAPVEVLVGKMEAGQMIKVQWRGKAVAIVNRTDEMMATLDAIEPRLADPASDESAQPEFAKNQHRSLNSNPNMLVVLSLCTHLGCSPLYRPDVAPEDLGPDWKGGFYCPCHGSKFDLSGRVYAGVPAPLNLEIPPYTYITPDTILIGSTLGASS